MVNNVCKSLVFVTLFDKFNGIIVHIGPYSNLDEVFCGPIYEALSSLCHMYFSYDSFNMFGKQTMGVWPCS